MKRSIAIAAAILMLVTLTVVSYAAGAAGHKEHHPRLRAAIKAIDAAIVELKAAPHDFGGHRADAVAACENAVSQLKQAVAFDAGGDAAGH
jgi:hypothetical protein